MLSHEGQSVPKNRITANISFPQLAVNLNTILSIKAIFAFLLYLPASIERENVFLQAKKPLFGFLGYIKSTAEFCVNTSSGKTAFSHPLRTEKLIRAFSKKVFAVQK